MLETYYAPSDGIPATTSQARLTAGWVGEMRGGRRERNAGGADQRPAGIMAYCREKPSPSNGEGLIKQTAAGSVSEERGEDDGPDAEVEQEQHRHHQEPDLVLFQPPAAGDAPPARTRTSRRAPHTPVPPDTRHAVAVHQCCPMTRNHTRSTSASLISLTRYPQNATWRRFSRIDTFTVVPPLLSRFATVRTISVSDLYATVHAAI